MDVVPGAMKLPVEQCKEQHQDHFTEVSPIFPKLCRRENYEKNCTITSLLATGGISEWIFSFLT